MPSIYTKRLHWSTLFPAHFSSNSKRDTKLFVIYMNEWMNKWQKEHEIDFLHLFCVRLRQYAFIWFVCQKKMFKRQRQRWKKAIKHTKNTKMDCFIYTEMSKRIKRCNILWNVQTLNDNHFIWFSTWMENVFRLLCLCVGEICSGKQEKRR